MLCHSHVSRMPFVCRSHVLVCHTHVIRMSLVCTCILSICTRMSYATRIFSYVICMSLLCTCMLFVRHSYALVCHLHVARMYSYVIRMSLVCDFTMSILSDLLGCILVKVTLNTNISQTPVWGSPKEIVIPL